MISSSKCEKNYADFIKRNEVNLDNTIICAASSNGKDTCHVSNKLYDHVFNLGSLLTFIVKCFC